MQDRILLPTQIHVQTHNITDIHLKVFNKLIATNPFQLLAVSSIVQRAPSAVPFVIFGP